jgi:hypothetical protein
VRLIRWVHKYGVTIVVSALVLTGSWEIRRISVNTGRLDRIEQRHRAEDAANNVRDCQLRNVDRKVARDLVQIALDSLNPTTDAATRLRTYLAAELGDENCSALAVP